MAALDGCSEVRISNRWCSKVPVSLVRKEEVVLLDGMEGVCRVDVGCT